MKFYCPVIEEDGERNGFEAYGTGYDPNHVFGPLMLVFHVWWCCHYNVCETYKSLRQARRVTRDAIIAKCARAFVYRNWLEYITDQETYLNEDPTFMQLCAAVHHTFGAPPTHDHE